MNVAAPFHNHFIKLHQNLNKLNMNNSIVTIWIELSFHYFILGSYGETAADRGVM